MTETIICSNNRLAFKSESEMLTRAINNFLKREVVDDDFKKFRLVKKHDISYLQFLGVSIGELRRVITFPNDKMIITVSYKPY